MPASPRRRASMAALTLALFLSSSLSACFSLDLTGPFDLCSGVGPTVKIQATPPRLAMHVGDSVTVVANQLDAKGNDTLLCDAEVVTWSSDSPVVAKIRAESGLATTVVAVAPGETTIRARTASRSAAVAVSVIP